MKQEERNVVATSEAYTNYTNYTIVYTNITYNNTGTFDVPFYSSKAILYATGGCIKDFGKNGNSNWGLSRTGTFEGMDGGSYTIINTTINVKNTGTSYIYKKPVYGQKRFPYYEYTATIYATGNSTYDLLTVFAPGTYPCD